MAPTKMPLKRILKKNPMPSEKTEEIATSRKISATIIPGTNKMLLNFAYLMIFSFAVKLFCT